MLFAIADGATEAYGSRRWARYLAASWVASNPVDWSIEELTEAVQRIGGRFSENLGARPLSWYAAEKAASGSFAAFLGLRVLSDGFWDATALGDCCLLQERGAELVEAFPVATSDAFTARPVLVPTLASKVYDVVTSAMKRHGSLNPGTVSGFSLMRWPAGISVAENSSTPARSRVCGRQFYRAITP